MSEELYGLTADQCERLRRMLEQSEGTLPPGLTAPPAFHPAPPVETYIGRVIDEITPAAEVETNLTTLDGAIDDTQTTIAVHSMTGMPTTGTFYLSIDDESMYAWVDGINVAVLRGWDGTTAASHSDGATVVKHVTTLGTGTVAISRVTEDENGEYVVDDDGELEPEDVYNNGDFTLTPGETVTLVREPTSGALVVASSSSAGSGITSINSESGPAITITDGTSGSDFDVVTTTNTITINLPLATRQHVGKVGLGTQIFGNTPTFFSSVSVINENNGDSGSLGSAIASLQPYQYGYYTEISHASINSGGSPTAVTQLNGAINNSQTSVTVDYVLDGSSNPKIWIGGYIQIESEFMLVTGIASGVTLTVVRGQFGSSAASHGDNTDVYRWGTSPKLALFSQIGSHNGLAVLRSVGVDGTSSVDQQPAFAVDIGTVTPYSTGDGLKIGVWNTDNIGNVFCGGICTHISDIDPYSDDNHPTANNVDYSPDQPGDWPDVPGNVYDALNKLAARLNVLEP